MLSNRESARRSRRRKQAHLGELQARCDALSEENARLLQKLHALHAGFNGVMQRNRVVKQNTAYLRAQLVAGHPITREAIEAATVAMNAGASAEQMLRVAAAGNATPASVGAAGGDGGHASAYAAGGVHAGMHHGMPLMPAGYLDAARMGAPGSDGRGAAMTSAAAAAAGAALGAGADPMFAPPQTVAFASAGASYGGAPMMVGPHPAGSGGSLQGKKAGTGRGRVTNFPIVAAGGVHRGRGSETSSLTYQHVGGHVGHVTAKAGRKVSGRGGSPNVSMQSVDTKSYTKSYANAVRGCGPRAGAEGDADGDAALAAAVAEHLSLPTQGVDHAMRVPDGHDHMRAALHDSPGAANLDHHEAALAATVAAHLAMPGGDAGAPTGGGGVHTHAHARSLVPRDFELPGGAASASAAAAVAAQCGLSAQQGSDGSRADAGGGSSGDGSDGAAHGGEGNGSGDVGAQSTRAPKYSLPDDAVKGHHHHREMTHHFHSPPAILEHDEHRGDEHRGDDEDENDALGLEDWFVEDGSGSGDPLKTPLDTRVAAQKMGRTDSMNRVASMERMAKRSARGDAA
jgi:hypothetical protein